MSALPPPPALLDPNTVRSHRVLLVDDEQANLTILRIALQPDFDIVCATSADEALAILAREPISVLLADHQMPGLTGVDLCEAVHSSWPEVERIILTAYSHSELLLDAINRGRVSRFMLKPWDRDEVGFVLREAIWRRETLAKLRQLEAEGAAADRLAALDIGAAKALHDVANALQPLNFDIRDLQSASAECPKPVQKRVDALALGLEHLTAIGQRVHKRRKRNVRASLQSVLSTVAQLHNPRIPSAGHVELTCTCDDDLLVRATDHELVRVLGNLVTNARQAILEGPGRGSIHIEARAAGPEHVQLLVVDDGPGVPETILRDLFRPGMTSREAAGGTGLGLAICKQLLAGWDADLSYDDAAEETTFVLTLRAVHVEEASV